MSAEKVALDLRDHQMSLRDWPYAALARDLHRWVEIFDREFKLNLPAYPVLHFAPLRNAYATYAWFRGDVGTKDNITFNTHELSGDPTEILDTLCHELLHLWQHYHGTPSPSNYHNAEYRTKALQCGLLVDPWGCSSGNTTVFGAVLSKYGIRIQPVGAPARLWGSGKREQKMKKWNCGCTNVRCAVQLDATCNICGRPFSLA